MTWSKRIKSFFISVGGLLLAAFIVVIVTPEGTAMIEYVRSLATGAGIPAVVVTFLGLLIAELWKQWLNSRKIAAAAKNFGQSYASVASRTDSDIELY